MLSRADTAVSLSQRPFEKQDTHQQNKTNSPWGDEGKWAMSHCVKREGMNFPQGKIRRTSEVESPARINDKLSALDSPSLHPGSVPAQFSKCTFHLLGSINRWRSSDSRCGTVVQQ